MQFLMQPTIKRCPRLIPKSKKELGVEYECCRETIRSMCHDIGIFTNKRLTIKEVKLFYDHYGVPAEIYQG